MESSIHVIEDDIDTREIYLKALEKANYDARGFATGEECLDVIRDGDWPDALIVDQTLPGMSGTDLLYQIKDLDIIRPSIIITGHQTKKIAIDGIGLGVHAVIEKPCNLNLILHHLSNIISHYKSLELAEHLLSEFSYFNTCSENLSEVYQKHINKLEKLVPDNKSTVKSLKDMIDHRETTKWEKEMARARGMISQLKERYRKIKKQAS